MFYFIFCFYCTVLDSIFSKNMGGPEKGRLGLDGISLPGKLLDGAAGLPLLKLSPVSAHGARVNGLVDPYHAYATHPHRPTVLAANLEMLPLPVADHTLPSQFFLCLDRPARNDREVAAVIDGVAPVLVQLQKYIWRRGPGYRNSKKRRRRGPGRLRRRRGPGRLRWSLGPGRLHRRSREGSHHGWLNVRDKIPEQIPGPNKGGLLGRSESTGPRIRQRVAGTGSSSANRIRPSSSTSDSSGG